MSVVLGRSEAGNALWLILLAIALLAGLTALVARTGGQSDDTGGTERVSIAASEIITYAADLKNAVARLIANGCSENEISFDNTNDGNLYANPSAPSDHSCDIFNANGAGVAWRDSPKNIQIYGGGRFQFATGSAGSIQGFGTDDKHDLFLMVAAYSNLPYAYPNFMKICYEINRRFGVPWNSLDHYQLAGPNGGFGFAATDTRFVGSFVPTTNGSQPAGKDYAKFPGFCARTGGTGVQIIFPLLKR